MKQTPKLLFMLVVAIVALSVAPDVLAQGAKGGRGQPRIYDTKTVETVRGQILSIDKTAPPADRGYGIHLTLKTDKETIPVHLGPASYVEKQTPRIEAKDTVEVTGSRVMIDGKPAIIAAQIKKGSDVLKLRDENGRPAWAGSGGRHGQPKQ